MALRPLTRITVRATDGVDHHFYLDLGNLAPGESTFLNALFPNFPDGVQYASQRSGAPSKLHDFVAIGYYAEEDLVAIKEALAKSIVATGDSPTPPNPRPPMP